MQHAVDAEANIALLATRLDMDVAGALLERILQQPVDQVHYMLVVGIRLADAAEFSELFEITDDTHAAFAFRAGPGNRSADAVKLARLIGRLSTRATSVSHSVSKGSAVAMVTSRSLTISGRN